MATTGTLHGINSRLKTTDDSGRGKPIFISICTTRLEPPVAAVALELFLSISAVVQRLLRRGRWKKYAKWQYHLACQRPQVDCTSELFILVVAAIIGPVRLAALVALTFSYLHACSCCEMQSDNASLLSTSQLLILHHMHWWWWWGSCCCFHFIFAFFMHCSCIKTNHPTTIYSLLS